MKFEIIDSFSLIGERTKQEDSYWHSIYNLLVCDGVGGQANGSLAASTVVEFFKENFDSKKIFQQKYIEGFINDIQNTFRKKSKEDINGSTTIALATIVGRQLVFLHLGDSRIYHFDKYGVLINVTKDHSLIQELKEQKILPQNLNPSDHPLGNVITKSFSLIGRTVYPEINRSSELNIGDFILCISDGILESNSNNYLLSEILKHSSRKEYIKKIRLNAELKSRDNSTLIAAEIIE